MDAGLPMEVNECREAIHEPFNQWSKPSLYQLSWDTLEQHAKASSRNMFFSCFE
jgi:hypothetical protein